MGMEIKTYSEFIAYVWETFPGGDDDKENRLAMFFTYKMINDYKMPFGELMTNAKIKYSKDGQKKLHDIVSMTYKFLIKTKKPVLV